MTRPDPAHTPTTRRCSHSARSTGMMRRPARPHRGLRGVPWGTRRTRGARGRARGERSLASPHLRWTTWCSRLARRSAYRARDADDPLSGRAPPRGLAVAAAAALVLLIGGGGAAWLRSQRCAPNFRAPLPTARHGSSIPIAPTVARAAPARCSRPRPGNVLRGLGAAARPAHDGADRDVRAYRSLRPSDPPTARARGLPGRRRLDPAHRRPQRALQAQPGRRRVPQRLAAGRPPRRVIRPRARGRIARRPTVRVDAGRTPVRRDHHEETTRHTRPRHRARRLGTHRRLRNSAAPAAAQRTSCRRPSRQASSRRSSRSSSRQASPGRSLGRVTTPSSRPPTPPSHGCPRPRWPRSARTRQQLKAVLLYDVVKGSVPASKVVTLRARRRSTPARRSRSRSAVQTVKVNGATVTSADVMASNGIIHVINRVLIPSGM